MALEGVLTRDAFLSHAGKLAEEVVEVAGLGKVLVRELTGAQRALVMEVLLPAVQEGGKAELARYQELLLQHGLVDSESPEDARLPLLDFASAKKAMQLGASKVEKIVGAVERLSGLDRRASERAEGNSGDPASSSSTSA